MATDWTRTRRAAVEFMVITVGVFAALLADEWRQSLRDRAEESQYVERLLVEIEANIEAMDGMTRRITNRSPALMRLATVRDLDDPAVRAQVARDLDESAGWSWGTFPGSRAVFDELVSTGRLSLIRDPRCAASFRTITRGSKLSSRGSPAEGLRWASAPCRSAP